MTRQRKREKRKPWPKEVRATVFLACLRRCALCVGLNGDWREKRGQLAHIDRDATNSTEANAAFLCLPHHDIYDSTSRHTNRHTPEELLEYKRRVVTQIAEGWPLPMAPRRSRKTPAGVSLDVYDRRLPVYTATIAFLRAVARGDELQMNELWAFANATEQALFLFDEKVADYLTLLFRKANLLRANYLNLQRPENWKPGAHEENMKVLLWFTEQFDEMREVFSPYLRIAPNSTKGR